MKLKKTLKILGILLLGIIGSLIAYKLSTYLWAKYSGVQVIEITDAGDNSQVTRTIALLAYSMVFVWPALLGLFVIHQFLERNSLVFKVIIFLIFLTTPIWFMKVSVFKFNLDIAAEEKAILHGLCVIKDGDNIHELEDGVETVRCKDGLPNGDYKRYASDGSLREEKYFLNGKILGYQKIYNSDRTLNTVYEVEKNKKSLVYVQIPETFCEKFIRDTTKNLCANEDERSKLNYGFTCSGNKLHGNWNELSFATVIRAAKYNRGLLHGKMYCYYPDGKVQSELNFIDDRKDGTVTSYFEDGTLKYQGSYKAGIQDGVFKRYSSSGELESEVVFENGSIVKEIQ